MPIRVDPKKTSSARAESTFRVQPKAQKQGRSKAKDRAEDMLGIVKANRAVGKVTSGKKTEEMYDRSIKASENKLKGINKRLSKEKKKRKMLSGGSRQTQKRRQGGY
jgi:hypothetical protein